MSTRKRGIVLFSVLIFCYTYVHQGPGWNQNSRLDLLHALFVHKTFEIDAYHENTGDKSIHNGHYYSDKAPGIVFLALPAFAAAAGLLKTLGIPLDSPRGWLVSDWIATAGSVGLLTALGGVAMFAFLCRLIDQRFAFLTVIIVFLGCAPFPYATMLFSHAAVIGLLCIALWGTGYQAFVRGTVHQANQNSPERHLGQSWQRDVVTGLCCGLAIASEYTAATAAGAVLAVASSISFKRGMIVGLSAIPALLLIPVYNSICFGSPFSFGYHYLALAEFQQMNKGLFGITLPPKMDAGYLLLVSPARGLFFWTPFMLVAFLGTGPLRKTSPMLFAISSFAVVLHILLISGYYMPNGGSALGARHLAPIVPLLTIATAFGLKRLPYCGSVLGIYSIVFTGFGTVVNAMPPTRMSDPLLDFYLPRVVQGSYASNLGSHLGLPNHGSALVCATVALSALIFAIVRLQPTCVNPLPHRSINRSN